MKLRAGCMWAILGLLTLDTAFAATIEFAEKWDSINGPGGDRCSIDINYSSSTETYDFKSGKNNECKNDQMSYFKLNDVPSATLIGLYAEANCRTYRKPDWYFILRVYIQPLSTQWYAIPDVEGTDRGKIFKRGLRVEENVYNQGNIKGKLSCVTILLK